MMRGPVKSPTPALLSRVFLLIRLKITNDDLFYFLGGEFFFLHLKLFVYRLLVFVFRPIRERL